jgi:hypothetical protein
MTPKQALTQIAEISALQSDEGGTWDQVTAICQNALGGAPAAKSKAKPGSSYYDGVPCRIATKPEMSGWRLIKEGAPNLCANAGKLSRSMTNWTDQ